MREGGPWNGMCKFDLLESTTYRPAWRLGAELGRELVTLWRGGCRLAQIEREQLRAWVRGESGVEPLVRQDVTLYVVQTWIGIGAFSEPPAWLSVHDTKRLREVV